MINETLDIDIITLGISRSSLGIMELFPSVKSVKYYELPELDYSLRPKVNTHTFHRNFLDGVNVYDLYKDALNLNTGNSLEVYNEAFKLLTKYDFSKYDYVLYPVGLVHPYHILIHEVVYKLSCKYDTSKFVLYSDKPYLGTRYARECMESYSSYYNYNKVSVNYEDRESIVKGTLSKVYPTELNMLRFSSDVLLKEPDIYLFETLTIKEGLIHESLVCNAI